MKNKINYIIREYPPEHADFSYYFDDGGLTAAGGDYYNNLFIVNFTRHCSGFNEKEYQRIIEQAEAIIDNFDDLDSGYSYYTSYKEVMMDNGIPYNSYKCRRLKEWAKGADTSKTTDIAAFLTITTGKQWSTDSARGYSQGDYVEMVYCPERYTGGVKHYGEIWLGAAKEFIVIELDEDCEEIDSCGGYIVADSQAWKDEDYKKIVCEWAGIPEDETRLEMIDYGQTYTYTKYSYRTA